MSHTRAKHHPHESKDSEREQVESQHGTRGQFVFGGFWALLCIGTILVSGPWAGFHGLLLVGTGLLIGFCPPTVSLPRLWWLLAVIFLCTGAAAFLPADWFTLPKWRENLESLGLPTGSRVVIQVRHAAESLGFLAIMLCGGLWFAGHRPSPAQLRTWAMAFTLGVAAYALISKIMQHPPVKEGEITHFGFFPNRNHTATYLAMGAVCGLGNLLQAQRDKRYFVMCLTMLSTGICLWAVVGWSVSRGGILLTAIGALAWLSMLGTRYLGKNGIRAVALMALAVIGGFLIIDTNVKQRLSTTVEKTGEAFTNTDSALIEEQPKPINDSTRDLDFRVPTMLDTLGMIRDFPWTGVGAGQFPYVFPQYRKLTALANDSASVHPESDWLWVASETGIPSALALALLAVLAIWKSLREIHHGRDRALRAGCLAAAILVPIHGLFDVPGHRITLAWSAIFLYTLSRHSSTGSRAALKTPSSRSSLIMALAFLCVGAWLMRAQWWGGTQPASIASKIARKQAIALYRQDQVLKNAAVASGRDYQPAPSEDPLEKALKLLEPASRTTPLDYGILRLQSDLASHFDDKYDLIEKNFALELALNPTWVAAPMRQAEALSVLKPDKSKELINEALRRADQVDQLKPDTIWSKERTLEYMRYRGRITPSFGKLIPPK